MAGDKVVGESSEAVSEPPGGPVAAGSRTVFLSYASADAEVANQVCQFLESQGVSCWMAPRDVKPGAAYADAIVRAINEASALVLVLSGSAMASEHVSREVERATSKHKQIVAFRVDAAALSAQLEYFLSRSQWIDVPVLGMPAALAKLAEAVGQGSAMSPHANPGLGGGGDPGRASIHQAVGTAAVARRVVVAAAVVIALGIGGVLAVRFWPSKHGESQAPVVAAISDKSIAVLPFTDMSEKKDQEYFADGMSEEIIDLLAKVPNLRVPARTSSFYFKGKSTKVPDIARELSVANVLEGSVRRSGNQLRVTAQLIRADSGFHVWSETYDRDLSDVFKVQDDIANAVAQALQISLMGGPLTRQAGGTQNLEAYLLYLRSNKELLGFSASATREARKNIEQAIKLDPDFILAWTMLGWINTNLAQLRELPIEQGYGQARQLAQHALQVSPDLADAHLLLGYIHRVYDWDWAAAQSEARRGLALDPKAWFALDLNGQIAASIGKWSDAEGYLRQVLAFDPLNPQTHWDLGRALYGAGRFAEADAEYRRVIELAPDFAWAHGYLATTLLAQGKPEAALAIAQQESDEANRLDILPIVLQAAGRQTEADAALNALTSKFADSDAYYVAANYAYRGDHDLAMQWLERAYQHKDAGFVEIVGEQLFKNMANDPRFKAFLKKMNLPE
jgi:TolB-like protein/Tfp pilus assembly protein PilF